MWRRSPAISRRERRHWWWSAASRRAGGAASTPPAAVRLSPTDPGPQGRVPQFVVECRFSHAAPDDPIVHPGHAGLSHLHTFFGSTHDRRRLAPPRTSPPAPTTCDQQLDRAAYWAPALLDGGVPWRPRRPIAYYRPGRRRRPRHGRALPVRAGHAGRRPHAADGPAARRRGLVVRHRVASAPPPRPTCPRGRPLRLAVGFPDCWDGEHLDSPDHRAHVARSERGRCPASHPVAVPQLLLTISYPVTGRRPRAGAGVRAAAPAGTPTSSTPGTRTSCGPRWSRASSGA